MSKNSLMLSDDMLKERSTVHGNLDPKLLYPEIKVVQDMYIHPILGTALFDKIISDITATGTTTGAYKVLLDDYIIDCIMYYVLSDLPHTLSYQFWNRGILRKTGNDTEAPSMSELVEIENRYRIKAEWYGERLAKYLKQTATSEVLPEYTQPGDGQDTIHPADSTFTMPIYLGPDHPCESLDKNNCHCNE